MKLNDKRHTNRYLVRRWRSIVSTKCVFSIRKKPTKPNTNPTQTCSVLVKSVSSIYRMNSNTIRIVHFKANGIQSVYYLKTAESYKLTFGTATENINKRLSEIMTSITVFWLHLKDHSIVDGIWCCFVFYHAYILANLLENLAGFIGFLFVCLVRSVVRLHSSACLHSIGWNCSIYTHRVKTECK